jgi:hypothetical protein
MSDTPENVRTMQAEDYLFKSEVRMKRHRTVAEMLLKESDRGCAVFGAAILMGIMG